MRTQLHPMPPDPGVVANSGHLPLTDARRACPAGADRPARYPVCDGVSGDKQAKAKLRRVESDEVTVAFGPPA